MPDRKPQKRRTHSQNPQFQPQPTRTGAQRQVDRLAVKERFLIVCEGEKTEPNYFKEFRVPGRILEIAGVGKNTQSLVDEALRLQRKASETFDQCWCVFDRDSFPAADFNNAVRHAEASGFQIAYTNESFEL